MEKQQKQETVLIIYLSKKPDSFCAASILETELKKSETVKLEMLGIDKKEIETLTLVNNSGQHKYNKIIFVDIVPTNNLLKNSTSISNSVDLYLNTILDARIYEKKTFLEKDINIFETEIPQINSVTKLVYRNLFSNKTFPKIIDLIDKSARNKDFIHYSVYRALTKEVFLEEFYETNEIEEETACLFSISKILNNKLKESTRRLIKNINFSEIDDIKIGFINCQNEFNQPVLSYLTEQKETLDYGIICNYFIYANLSVGIVFKLFNTDIVSEEKFKEITERLNLKGYKYAAGGNISIEELAKLLVHKFY